MKEAGERKWLERGDDAATSKRSMKRACRLKHRASQPQTTMAANKLRSNFFETRFSSLSTWQVHCSENRCLKKIDGQEVVAAIALRFAYPS